MPLPKVLITRPLADAHSLANTLTQRGYDPVIDPLLEITPLDFTMPAGEFAAILITSANALPALQKLDRGIAVLTVGETTAALAAEGGFAARCLGRTVEEAIPVLAGMQGPILYLSGKYITQEIPGAVRVPVYVARQCILEKATIEFLSGGKIGWIVLYSRRSAEALEKVIATMANRDWIRTTGLVCLSARTAGPLQDMPWRDIVIAPAPTEAALIAALEAA